jgi:hypothetical protein
MEKLFNQLIRADYKFPHLLSDKRGLKELHKLLVTAYNDCDSVKYDVYLQHDLPKLPHQHPSKYFPSEIQKLISNQSRSCSRIKFRTPKRIITLDFVFMKNDSYSYFSLKKYIPCLQLWFSLLDNVTRDDSINQTLNIVIYLTGERKTFPETENEILSSKHINSALTYICQKHGDIMIYREEEWFKVLLHECMHSYCLDFSNHSQQELNSCLQKTLPIQINDPHYSETYAEVWAELLNIGILSFSEKWHLFSLRYEFYLQLEVVHSISKFNTILAREGLSVATLREKKHLNQETHVYEYHILKTILLYSAGNFLNWCLKNNGPTLIPFRGTMVSFCKLINDCYEEPNFSSYVITIGSNFNSKSLRMSICEV